MVVQQRNVSDWANAIAVKPALKRQSDYRGGTMAHLKMEGFEAEMLPILVKTFPRAFFPLAGVASPSAPAFSRTWMQCFRLK